MNGNILTLSGLSPTVRTNIGLLAGTKPFRSYPYLEIFNKAPVLPMTTTGSIEFDYVKDLITTAELNKRAAGKNTVKIKEPEYRRVILSPSEIYADQSLTANELLQMQPGQPQVMVIGGAPIPSSEQVAQRKIKLLRDSLDSRKNIMCTQLINDGKVLGKNSEIVWDFNLPEARKATYSTANGFLKLVKQINREYIKINNGMPADRFLIGSDIADKILEDEALQQTMYRLNMTTVAKDLTSDEKSRIIGTFMGQNIEEMAYSFDNKGVEIISGNVIKLLNTSMLFRGYAAIEVQKGDLPAFYLGDEYIDIQPGDKKNPTASMFVKSGFMPGVVDPISIQTWNITLA